MKRLLALTLAGLAAAAPVFAQSKFTLRVHTGRGQSGYDVNSTMIIGEKDVLVIDPQFSLSEAHKLAAEMLESRKHVAVIYCTHPHPDHLFGLAVLKQAFPDAKIVALPATVNAAKYRLAGPPEVLVRPRTAATFRARIPVCPRRWPDRSCHSKASSFPITGGVQGADGPATASSTFRHSRPW